MTPLFFIGNVRSGTSQLVRMLNKHHEIFVSHESDICWILYQYEKYGKVKEKSFGGQKALKYTLKNFGKYINPEMSPYENFVRVQTKLMRKGSLWLPPMKKKKLIYIGDKTPNNFIVCKEYREFCLKNFPRPLFIHCVRHPNDFVASVKNRIKEHPYFGKTDKEILQWWIDAEKTVIKLKDKLNIITVRYEDIGLNASNTMGMLFDKMSIIPAGVYKNTFAKKHDYYIELPSDARDLIEIYQL